MTWANARDWRARADREARVFLAAALFLTRLPLRPAEFPPLPPLREAARHFGLVGALLGLAAGCVWGLAGMALPSALAALLAVGALLAVTGALHEDGLADLVRQGHRLRGLDFVDHLQASLVDHAGHSEFPDDLSAVVIERHREE